MKLEATYTDIKEIGSGGGGTVFRAFHIRMQKYVVLKKIHDNIKNSVDIRGELDILKNLRHEYLPTVLDFIEDEGSIYTVMDYVEGESFENLLKKGQHFSQRQVIKYAIQLGQVLKYLHGQNVPIVHGDIKPANIMLTNEDNICLIDFNISQFKNGSIGLNMGYTPGFAAPEQIQVVKSLQRNKVMDEDDKTSIISDEENIEDKTMLLDSEKDFEERTLLLNDQEDNNRKNKFDRMTSVVIKNEIDERSDIFSVGATLYALLSGKTPSADLTQVVPIETLVENCSEGLAQLIRKCMRLKPSERFQSAEHFSKAVSSIAKVNRKYRSLVFRQNFAIIVYLICITLCIITTILGKEKIERDKENTYYNIVEQMEESKEDTDKFENLFVKAVEMFPNYSEAYYQKASMLYEKRKFEELIDFISYDVDQSLNNFTELEIASFYHLLASAYLELDDAENALLYYATALKYYPYDSLYYSDYAIALARQGDLEKANEALEKAVEMGLSNDKVLLVQGEIALKQGNYMKAEEYFSECIKQTNNSYILLRAYVIWGKMYDENTDEEKLLKKVTVLTEGIEKIENADRIILLEQLAQTYIDLGLLTGSSTYNMEAIEYLKQIINLGWDTFLTHYNLGILYELIGEYTTASEEYSNMLTLYGEDYRIYKRLAFLEVDIQNDLENSQRDYGRFLDYYNQTMTLFEASNVRKDSDMEIQMLEQIYMQLESGNWF